MEKPATDMAPNAGGVSKNMWKAVHFGAPQITKTVILFVLWIAYFAEDERLFRGIVSTRFARS